MTYRIRDAGLGRLRSTRWSPNGHAVLESGPRGRRAKRRGRNYDRKTVLASLAEPLSSRACLSSVHRRLVERFSREAGSARPRRGLDIVGRLIHWLARADFLYSGKINGLQIVIQCSRVFDILPLSEIRNCTRLRSRLDNRDRMRRCRNRSAGRMSRSGRQPYETHPVSGAQDLVGCLSARRTVRTDVKIPFKDESRDAHSPQGQPIH